ncbi:MAG: hypothetical protein LAO31_21375 [Acidobacteriia bacterium]|nr:hypothetical protein [Terriglobia bacterium]
MPRGMIKIIQRGGSDQGPDQLEKVNDAFSKFVDSLSKFEVLPALTLQDYIDLVRPIPPPTDEQIEKFASFVSEAKSWYKHLRLWPPEEVFHFFIDPFAGFDCLLSPEGTATFVRRNEHTPKFHQTWMTTAAYHERFGHLSFSSEAGSRQYLQVSGCHIDSVPIDGFIDQNPVRDVIYWAQDRPRKLPPEVFETSGCAVSGIIHPLASCVWVWESQFGTDRRRWPIKTAETRTLFRIRKWLQARRQKMTASSAENQKRSIQEANPELEALLRPIREGIRGEMIKAMKRMRGLVYQTI